MCSPIESRPLASRLGAWPVAAGFSRIGQRRARVAAAQFPPTPPRQTSHHTPNDLPLGQTRQETGGNWRLPSSQAVRNMVASENQFSLTRAAPNAGGRARIKFFSAGPRPNPSTDLLAGDRQDQGGVRAGWKTRNLENPRRPLPCSLVWRARYADASAREIDLLAAACDSKSRRSVALTAWRFRLDSQGVPQCAVALFLENDRRAPSQTCLGPHGRDSLHWRHVTTDGQTGTFPAKRNGRDQAQKSHRPSNCAALFHDTISAKRHNGLTRPAALGKNERVTWAGNGREPSPSSAGLR